MGVRPPANDDDGSDVIEFGIAALDASLSDADIEYPTDAGTLSNELGQVEVPYDAHGHTIAFDHALTETEEDRFENEQALLNALHPIFEAKRQAAGNSVLAQLRSLIPF